MLENEDKIARTENYLALIHQRLSFLKMLMLQKNLFKQQSSLEFQFLRVTLPHQS